MKRSVPLIAVAGALLLPTAAHAVPPAVLDPAGPPIPVVDYTGGGSSEQITDAVALDIDQDGVLDIAGVGRLPWVHAFGGLGDGRFPTQERFEVGTDPLARVDAGDVDGDGRTDLVVTADPDAFGSAGGVQLLLSDGDEGFLAPRRITTEPARDAIVTDLDRDGDADIVAVTASRLIVWRGTGGGAGALDSQPRQLSFTARGPLAAVDLSRDRRPELLVGTATGTRILRNASGVSFPSQQTLPVPGGPLDFATGDITGDGRPDVVIGSEGNFQPEDCPEEPCPPQDPAEYGRTSVYEGTGGARVALISERRPSNRPHTSVALADFDGDGHLDLASTYGFDLDDTQAMWVETWRGHDQTVVGFAEGWLPWILAADFDDDGRDDLIAAVRTRDELLFFGASDPGGAELVLNARESANDGYAGPVSTNDPLTNGQVYSVIVDGMWSAWPRARWTDPTWTACGDVDLLWRYSHDAWAAFAGLTRDSCDALGVPVTTQRFQVNLGSGWFTPEPAELLGDHTYRYTFQGQGQPLQARIQDSTTSDNTGALVITSGLG